MPEVVDRLPNEGAGNKHPFVWPAHAPMPGPQYVYAVVFTAADHGVVEQVKCINDKVEPVHFVDENLRPKRKSTFVRLGRLKGLRANQETRPPVGPAKVLTSARVIPPSPAMADPRMEVPMFALYG